MHEEAEIRADGEDGVRARRGKVDIADSAPVCCGGGASEACALFALSHPSLTFVPDLGRSGSTRASLLGCCSLPAELLPIVPKPIISPDHLLLRGIMKIKGLQVR